MGAGEERVSQRGSAEIPAERTVFASNLRQARRAAGLTQEAVRELTGFSQAFISNVEGAKSSINLDNAAILAAVVGRPLWELLVP